MKPGKLAFAVALRAAAGNRQAGLWLFMAPGAAAAAPGAFWRDLMLLTGPGANGESWHNQVHDEVSGIADAAMVRYAGCEAPFSMARTRRVTVGSPSQ